ncbi:hypothetical protein LTR56_027259 [Elasticomyces elasticus]|nr:hypothetical protein LTR56_027259 [Elasticomyces elasticus]KAK3615598.1 hypothetical protein LTR22_027370 [Elasticomyces elasticus]KAK5729817.1 hypothetical protein LTS12_027288 [Elasticomyces elasticus]
MAVPGHFDLVVVGGGFSGLSAAKVYLQCAPDTKLVILDNNKTIGGVWATERLYTGLRSNNLRGMLEFPDYPLHDGFGVKEGEYLPGTVVHDYLAEYAKHWSIYNCIRFESKALHTEQLPNGEGWHLTSHDEEAHRGNWSHLTTSAIHVKGQESYNAPIVNTASLLKYGPELLGDPNVTQVTVIGTGKSAYDAIYTFASAGKQVDWVIRKDDHGPAWMSKSHIILGPLGKFWVEHLVTRRFFAWMSPCLWGDIDGSGSWRHFLHRTWLGRNVSNLFWWKMSADILEQSGYNDDPKLKALHPDRDIFSTATTFAILNYPTDVLQYVRDGQVKVYHENISRLSDHAVHLQDGTMLNSSAFVASTGWLHGPAVDFTHKATHSELGITSLDYTEEDKTFWEKLDAKADAEIFRMFPKLATLADPPCAEQDLKDNPFDEVDSNLARREYQPWRLYRSLISPGLAAKGGRSLAFAGFSANITGHIRNEISGLWIYAYMNDQLTIDPCRDVDDVYWDVAMLQRFCLKRYPYGFGRRFQDFFFDAVPWNDVLLKDLGLSGRRKGGSWWRECFEPYKMDDYRGITAEWLAKQKDMEAKKS